MSALAVLTVQQCFGKSLEAKVVGLLIKSDNISEEVGKTI